ncbi:MULTISPECIES: luciferase domain-containing protein [Rhodococcus]|uniref:luciferase domain-containing protein n=1 Tax=Rhodococcus TaxID=1827 RepID=UPI0022863EDA|nr:luciferase family protein [Rhodococcus sp. JS3073]WAM11902.1 DUF5519 family protein [Rhodococcus sp. JS3073]
MSAVAFGQPVTATYGSADPTAPLVVLLHGRGSNEREILSLATQLPGDIAYTAVRAPLAEGSGFAWFANRGIGRPLAASIALSMKWFRSWLDSVAPTGRPVILVGFSGGAAFAGGLILDDPARFTGAAVLYGTLPFDAGLSVEPARLAHLPVFVAQGDQDHVIPAELLERTWNYLLSDSGAPTEAHRDPGGHGLSATVVSALGEWIAHRLRFVKHQHVPSGGPRAAVRWPTVPGGRLPDRRGPHPRVSWSIPQQQRTDNAPVHLQERLLAHVREMAGVTVGASHISVPGAVGFSLEDRGPDEQAYLVPSAGEFAHLHPQYDGSLHLTLPADLAADLVAHGWGRMHPWAGTRLSPGFVMVYGPRDEDELATIQDVVAASHAYATGWLIDSHSSENLPLPSRIQ